MSDKKRMGSKLAQGVRRIQSQRDQQPASSTVADAMDEAGLVTNDTPPTPSASAPVVRGAIPAAKPSAPQPNAPQPAAPKPNAPQPAVSQPDEKNKNDKLHPKRVWPD